jgi:hypothetical protein
LEDLGSSGILLMLNVASILGVCSAFIFRVKESK